MIPFLDFKPNKINLTFMMLLLVLIYSSEGKVSVNKTEPKMLEIVVLEEEPLNKLTILKNLIDDIKVAIKIENMKTSQVKNLVYSNF